MHERIPFAAFTGDVKRVHAWQDQAGAPRVDRLEVVAYWSRARNS